MLAMSWYLVSVFFQQLFGGVRLATRRTLGQLAASDFRIEGLEIADIYLR